MSVEVFKKRVINHYEISEGKYKITLVCDGGSSGGVWGVSHKVFRKEGKDGDAFCFRNPEATEAIGRLLIKAAEVMKNEPSD